MFFKYLTNLFSYSYIYVLFITIMSDNQPSTIQTIKDQFQKIPETINVANIQSSVNTGVTNLTDSINTIKTNVSNSLNDFSSKNTMDAGYEFLQSNSIIAKFAFIILVLIGFMFLLNLGIRLISYFIQPNNSPYLVVGTISGSEGGGVIKQNPKDKKSVLIKRSVNQTKGIEFTWSTWLYITELPSGTTSYNHIFNKGDVNDSNKNSNDIFLNNAPGLYLKRDDTDNTRGILRVYMDTVVSSNSANDTRDTNTYVDVQNVPLKKWFNVIVRLENKILDVYVNGTISNRLVLNNVPKQNYYDVNVCKNGGFSGKLSNLRYFNYALTVFDINTIVLGSPNLKPGAFSSDGNTITDPTSSYLSTAWYSSNRNSGV